MRTIRRSAAAAAAVLAAGAAEAITINDAVGAVGALALGAPFESVGRVVFNTAGCTGSLVTPTVFLTANHCIVPGVTLANTTVRFTAPDGTVEQVRGAVAVTFAEPFSAGATLLNGFDIALVTLDAPVTDRPVFRLTDEVVVGETVRFVGYGDFGLGSTGSGPSDGARRAADNVIDFYGPAPIDTPFTGIFGSANIYTSDFDDPADPLAANTLGWLGSDGEALPNEGSTSFGDSGGPLLVRRLGEWLIAGVLSGGLTPAGGQQSGYGDLSYWTSVGPPGFREGLESFGIEYARIPLPAGGPLLLGALALGGLLRRRSGATQGSGNAGPARGACDAEGTRAAPCRGGAASLR